MSEAAARARKDDPIAWLCSTVLQSTVYRDTLCTRLSIFESGSKAVTNTHRAEKRCRFLTVEIFGDRRDMSNI
jgi:hypothetical protein